MTAVFGTPVAAVLLAVELLLFEMRPRSLLPVAMACAVAGFARPLFFGAGPLFPLQTAPPPGLSALLSCVVAGLLRGALASALSAALYKVEDLFAQAAAALDVVAGDRRPGRSASAAISSRARWASATT